MSTETQDIEIVPDHTPGPWGYSVVSATGHAGSLFVAHTTDGEVNIAEFDEWDDDFRDQMLANARLIAQAPQLQAKVVEQQQTIEALRDERDALREKGRAMIDAIDHFARETNETWTSVDVAEKIVAAYKGLSEALMQCEHRELLAKASAQAIDVRQQD